MSKPEDTLRKLVEGSIKRKIDLAMNKVLLRIESLEIKFAAAISP